jgi:NRAMP (natural resistance-associated macrophage protein)-like metal ion transporter
VNKKLKKILSFIGPGFITGASDDDPSGIGTYSQTGAQFGLSQLWVALFSIPFMIAIQEMCGRIGLVTGKGLAYSIRQQYGQKIVYATVAILVIANTLTIGADLGAMAATLQLLIPLPFALLLIGITTLTLVLEIFVTYTTYAKVLKYFALSLLAYVATAAIVRLNWIEVFTATIIPHIAFTKEYLFNIVALLGTTISPYLFFWQASEETEERITRHESRAIGHTISSSANRFLHTMRYDTVFGMVFSNLITFFIIATTAATLGQNGIRSIETAADTAAALSPLAGSAASFLFALGIIGTGLLAVPVLAGSASYALAETLDLKMGLYKKFSEAHGFYGIITIATLAGLAINFFGIPPFKLLYYVAVLNGILAPPLMIIILRIATNRTVMGDYVNSRRSSIVGYTITGIMSIAAVALILSALI